MNKGTVRLYENERFQEASSFMLRPGGLSLTRKAVEIARFDKNNRILDIGSGCGTTVAYLTDEFHFRAMGMDISEKLTAKAKTLGPTLNLVIGDVYLLPWTDCSMDGIFCECTYNLFEDKPIALKQMHRVLKTGGKLIISDLYLKSGQNGLAPLPLKTCINGITSPDVYLKEVANSGFRLIHWQNETRAYKELIAALIMKYGSISVFWESLTDSCDSARTIEENLKNVQIGYYLSVWEKKFN